MIKQKVLYIFLLFLVCFPLLGINDVVTLKTGNMDEVIGIYSFLMNTKGEIFLFSSKMSKIFKFKPDGTFEKSFCQKGEGPGEIQRVFFMTHNPNNNYLYLPEYYSMGKGRVTIYDSDGNYKGLLKPSISREDMDRISKIIFLTDGSYFIVTQKRVGWKPIGKLFKTQDEVWVRHFDQHGKMISEVFKTTVDDELSNALRYGGPRILFNPSLLVRLTPENHIAVTKTDENEIAVYDTKGNKVKTITLDIPREKLTDEEFNNARKLQIEGMKKYDSRMVNLAKKMIKLEFKPFYRTIFVTPGYIILSKIVKEDETGYPQKNKLIFSDWQGNKKGEKVVDGLVMNVTKNGIFVISYDDEANEHFRIEPAVFDFDKK